MVNPNAIPYQPLNLDSMLGPPEELPPPDALFVAEEGIYQAPEAESNVVSNDASLGAPAPNDASRYAQYGLRGDLSEQDASAIQQALTDELISTQERADAFQRKGTEGK